MHDAATCLGLDLVAAAAARRPTNSESEFACSRRRLQGSSTIILAWLLLGLSMLACGSSGRAADSPSRSSAVLPEPARNSTLQPLITSTSSTDRILQQELKQQQIRSTTQRVGDQLES